MSSRSSPATSRQLAATPEARGTLTRSARGRPAPAARGDLPRCPHAADLPSAAQRGPGRRHRQRPDSPRIRVAHRRPRAGDERHDRRPVRALASGGRRHQLDDGTGTARGSGARDRRRDARPGRGRLGFSSRRADAGPRGSSSQSRADPASPVQPDSERDPAYAGRWQRDRAARASPRMRCRSRCSTPAHGIPPAERERVFDAFVQGSDRASRSDGSAGLGLAISRAIVEAHGGRIWIEDATRRHEHPLQPAMRQRPERAPAAAEIRTARRPGRSGRPSGAARCAAPG